MTPSNYDLLLGMAILYFPEDIFNVLFHHIFISIVSLSVILDPLKSLESPKTTIC